MMPVAGF